MKKLMKTLAIILAIMMTLTFFACDANMDAEANKGEAGYDEILGGAPNADAGISPSDPQYSISGTPSDPSDDNYDEGEDISPEQNAPTGAVTGAATEEGAIDSEVKDPEVEGETNVGETDAVVETGSVETGSVETGSDGESATASPAISLIEKPFTSVADNPFSTFSADVDTASYSYFRKMVSYGYTIKELRYQRDNFRTEEFINYFRYNANEPSEGELFGVKTSLVPCPWNEETLLFVATLQTETPKIEAPNNLVFLIDVSGSMSSSDKLPLLKKAFSYLVGSLKPNDTVSIVTYSGREAIVLDGCSGADTQTIMNAINSLQAGGSTNGEAGLTMAYQIAEKHMKEGSNNRIIMASDGDLNVGISSADQLKSYIEGKRDQGIYLSVLGFGTGNYKDDRMESLADNGNGVYYYIDGESEAEKVFGTDLVGTLYTVANDVKLQIEFNTQRVESYRLIGYDNRVLDKEDFENDTKDAGEVGAGHRVTVCYEIKLAKIEDKDAIVDAPLMTLRVRYKNPGEPVSRLNEYMISGVTNAASDDVRFIAAVIELVSLIRNPDYKGSVTVESILDELKGLNLTDPYKIEFRELVQSIVIK